MNDAPPVRRPRFYARVLAAIHDVAHDHGPRLANLSEDLRDHLQIAGVTELEGLIALISAAEESIRRLHKTYGDETGRALRFVASELIKDGGEDDAVS